MTIDDLKRVREAADIVLGRFGCHRADCRDVAKYIFATIPADFDQPVTWEWMVAVFGLEKAFETESTIKLQLETEKGWCDICIRKRSNVIEIIGESPGLKCNNSIANCTRYQFRLLAAALGIKRKWE